MAKRAKAGGFAINSDIMRARAIDKVGERAYFEGLEKSWTGIKSHCIPGFKVKWGHGMRSVIDGWDALASGQTEAAQGLTFKI